MSARHLSVLPSKEINPARSGLSKSTVLAGSYCGRKAHYIETVRNADGSRVSNAMPERVVFGAAVDVASLALMAWHKERLMDDERHMLDLATELGMDAAREKQCSDFIDWEDFRKELALAVFMLQRWLVSSGMSTTLQQWASFQGLDGESLRYDDPEFGELVGTPDMLIKSEDGEITVVDVKAAARKKSVSDLHSAEMSFYVYLSRRALALDYYPGVAYLTWVRSRSPEWQLVAGPSSEEHEVLARQYIRSTKSAIMNAEATTFNTGMCSSCDWRKPIAGLFDGCPVGRSVATIKEAQHEQA